MENDSELVVENVGDHFTFMSKLGQTIIDATLSTAKVNEKISQWHVVDSVINSDHLSIEMLLEMEGAWTPPLQHGILAIKGSLRKPISLKWRRKAQWIQ